MNQWRKGKPTVQEDPHIQNCKTILKMTKTTPQGRQNLRESDLCKTVKIVEKQGCLPVQWCVHHMN